MTSKKFSIKVIRHICLWLPVLKAIILGCLDHTMLVYTDIWRETFPIHRNQAPGFSLGHLTESVEYQNHQGKFPNGLFSSKLQDKHFICGWLRASSPCDHCSSWVCTSLCGSIVEGPRCKYSATGSWTKVGFALTVELLRGQCCYPQQRAKLCCVTIWHSHHWPSPQVWLQPFCPSVLTLVLVVAVVCPAPDAGHWAARSQSHGQATNCFEELNSGAASKAQF